MDHYEPQSYNITDVCMDVDILRLTPQVLLAEMAKSMALGKHLGVQACTGHDLY